MSTSARIEANRRNAAKSTGPRTSEGKARSSRNATRHGISLRMVILSTEDQKEFENLYADLRVDHQPEGATEDILVFKMAEAFFMSQRANALMAGLLVPNDQKDNSKQLSLMMRYFTSADRAFGRHLNDLRKLQKERSLEDVGFVSENEFDEVPGEPVETPVPPQNQEIQVENQEIQVEKCESDPAGDPPPLDIAA
jgi:hypothetical protein